MKRNNSEDLLARAQGLIPQLSQTMSKSPEYFTENYPRYIEQSEYAYLYDVDGNKYTDWICGLGTSTLGYGPNKAQTAAAEHIWEIGGPCFSFPHRLEVELSELMREVIPCCEAVRFSKTGSEVCNAALKIARAYTGKDKFVSWGYHGWHPEFTVLTDRAKGIPKSYSKYIIPIEYNDVQPVLDAFEQHPNEIAAVFIEPVTFTPPFPGYLRMLKDICHKNGALLIFDEMVTGFRWALGGAQQYYEVTPDLATFGKGMANGWPIAAVCGRKDVMKECESIFFSTTFGGEAVSMAAAIATIKFMRDSDYFNHIWNDIGVKLNTGLELPQLGMTVAGYACRPYPLLVDETPELRSLLMQELCKRGFLIHSGAWNICYAHTVEDVKKTVDAVVESLTLIKEGKVRLEGPCAKMSFRRL